LEDLERLRLELGPLPLEHRAPGDDHVAARAVELEDREAPPLADIAVEVPAGTEIGVRPRQEGGHADVDLEATLHLADDRAVDRPLALEGLLDLAPHPELLGLVAGEHDLTRLVVARLEVHVDLVTFLHGDRSITGGELVDGDVPFGLVADVDRDAVAPD